MRVEDFKEVVEDTTSFIRLSRPSRTRAFDAYIEGKEKMAKEYENKYLSYKGEILGRGLSQGMVFGKLEFMFDNLLELKAEVQMLKDYRKVS
jgi:hypothetical protein